MQVILLDYSVQKLNLSSYKQVVVAIEFKMSLVEHTWWYALLLKYFEYRNIPPRPFNSYFNTKMCLEKGRESQIGKLSRHNKTELAVQSNTTNQYNLDVEHMQSIGAMTVVEFNSVADKIP